MLDELSAARITLSLNLPRPVKQVEGGVFNASRAEYTLPLLDVMVLDKPIAWQVWW
jgi:hypothetical protein